MTGKMTVAKAGYLGINKTPPASRNFGGFKVTFPDEHKSDAYIPNPNEPRVPDWPTKYPQAAPFNGTHPLALDNAAWYIAGVLCERHGHKHPFGEWPCQRSIAYALGQVHIIAAHNFPSPTTVKANGSPKKTKENPTGKSTGNSRRIPRGKPRKR